ncbi:MAG TPA: hypothetical protein VMO26_02270 [Vicinamibacterales bacterium]|nr:hypothetical protein [Vicinamibacterales bacterium]
MNTTHTLARSVWHTAWYCLIVCGLVVQLRAEPQITVGTGNREVTIAFQLPVSDGDDVVPALAACAKVTARYSVELRRIVPGWLDRVMATALVQNAAECVEGATSIYRLERRLNNDVVAESPAADERGAVRFLTEFDALPLFSAWMVREPGTYGIRVRVRAIVNRGGIIPPIKTGVLAETAFSIAR